MISDPVTQITAIFILLQKLPKAPVLEHLSLQQNNIESLEGISNLRKTKISSLTLRDNPIELDPNYRQK